MFLPTAENYLYEMNFLISLDGFHYGGDQLERNMVHKSHLGFLFTQSGPDFSSPCRFSINPFLKSAIISDSYVCNSNTKCYAKYFLMDLLIRDRSSILNK